MSNFWHRIDITDRNAGATLKLPPAAKIQTGDRGVYPWESECKRQVAELGNNALARIQFVKPTKDDFSWAKNEIKILEAIAELRELVAHNVPAIEFKARRLPRTCCGADMD